MIKENEDEPELDETNKENFNGSFKIIYNEEANIDDFNQLQLETATTIKK